MRKTNMLKPLNSICVVVLLLCAGAEAKLPSSANLSVTTTGSYGGTTTTTTTSSATWGYGGLVSASASTSSTTTSTSGSLSHITGTTTWNPSAGSTWSDNGWAADTVEVPAPYRKSHRLTGVLSTADGGLFARFTLTLGKANRRNGQVKIGGVAIDFDGTRYAAPATYAVPGDDGTLVGSLDFGGPVGTLPVTFESRDGASVALAKTALTTASCQASCEGVGGTLPQGGGQFRVTSLEGLALPVGFTTVAAESAWSVPCTFTAKKISFPKTVRPAIVPARTAGGGYAIVLREDANMRGVKLVYDAKTGVFKGSYTLFAVKGLETAARPKLKGYRATVNGVVVDGSGEGRVTCKIGRTKAVGTCVLVPDR